MKWIKTAVVIAGVYVANVEGVTKSRKVSNAKYYKANVVKLTISAAARYQADKVKRAAASAARYQANKVAIAAANKKKRAAANKEKNTIKLSQEEPNDTLDEINMETERESHA